MSLSQKHSGLVLVPWFNKDEWRYVYTLAYSDDREKQLKALQLLKMWKMRTPILPTGVEGTLILLDALIIGENDLPCEQISQLYSVALMRFLNLSAANSDKQGSFMRTSKKNDLPKWLINLRHDIAHGHKIPSKFNLKMGLHFGFKWIKEKYWESQQDNLNDLYSDVDYTENDLLTPYFRDYMYLSLALFDKQELDENCLQNIMDKIHTRYKKKITDSLQIFGILEEIIKQGIQSGRNNEELLNILLSNEAMLKVNIEVDLDKDIQCINLSFKNIWKNILNLLHEFNLLSTLIEKLFEIISNIFQPENTKKMAALWIRDILKSLTRLKHDPNDADLDCLEINSNQYTYSKELLEFQNKVLLSPNKYSLYFLDCLLKYNENSEEFSTDAADLINLDSCQNLKCIENKIFTVSDLVAAGVDLEDEREPESVENSNNVINANNYKPQITAGSTWKKIEDTSIFRNCPIGVLPHQISKTDPFLLYT